MAHGLNCTAWLGNRISEEESLHRSTCAVGYYTLGGFGASMFSNSGRGLRSGNRLYRRFSQRDLRRLAPVSAYQSKKNSFCVLNALNSPVFHVSSHLNCAFVNANYSFAFHAFIFFFFHPIVFVHIPIANILCYMLTCNLRHCRSWYLLGFWSTDKVSPHNLFMGVRFLRAAVPLWLFDQITLVE